MNATSCEGLLFRASVSSFVMFENKRKYLQSGVRLRFIKSRSCPGCEHCFWLWEAMSEQMYNTDGFNPTAFHDGSIYTPRAEGDSDDFEIMFDRVESCLGKKVRFKQIEQGDI